MLSPDGKTTKGPCQVCPLGADCNGESLRTAGNLVGARWQASGNRMFLKECPPGYRLVNSTGYEFQVCMVGSVHAYIDAYMHAYVHT